MVIVLRNITSYPLVIKYQRFGGSYCTLYQKMEVGIFSELCWMYISLHGLIDWKTMIFLPENGGCFYHKKMNTKRALLRYYAAQGGDPLPTFRDHVSVPSSRVVSFWSSWPSKLVPVRCPETSGKDHHSALRNIPEEHRKREITDTKYVCAGTSSLGARQQGGHNTVFNCRAVLPAPPPPRHSCSSFVLFQSVVKNSLQPTTPRTLSLSFSLALPQKLYISVFLVSSLLPPFLLLAYIKHLLAKRLERYANPQCSKV
jgi:hypothetical protein